MSTPWSATTQPQTVLWDLDGALIDSSLGIFEGIDVTLERLGQQPASDTDKQQFIGPPLLLSFRKLTTSEELAHTAVDYYRDYYREKGQYHFSVKPGVSQIQRELQQAGCKQFVATSKTEEFAANMCEEAGFTDYLTGGRDGVHGANADLSINAKADVIALALPKIKRGEPVVMIGDRHHDIDGAAQHQIPAIGVTWGFGSEEELRAAKPTAIAHTPDELRYILGLPAAP